MIMSYQHNGSIWALILAAGESKRMGSPKMLLPFKGDTMLGIVIRNVKGSEVDGVMVVLGAEKKKTAEIAGKLNVSYCFNADYKQGMLSSVKCGISSLPDDPGAILIFQGDQPLIRSETGNMLINAYRNSSTGILIPVYAGQRGHPLLIDNKYREEIMKISPDVGLRALSQKFPEDVLEIESDDPGILKDFDTLEEYKNEINQIS